MLDEKVRELVEMARKEPGVERSLGSNLGFSLGQGGGRETVEAFIDAVAAPIGSREPASRAAFLDGYLACIRDIGTGYVRGADELKATDPKELGLWVTAHRGALDVLNLANEHATVRVSDVADALGKPAEAQWSRLMKEMRGLRLLQSIPGPDARERPHALTLLGQRVLAWVREEDEASRERVTPGEVDVEARAVTLAANPSAWNKQGFERATARAKRAESSEEASHRTSYDVQILGLALESLEPRDAALFVRALYSWDVYRCAQTLLHDVRPAERRRVPRDLEVAVLCSVAERVWDPFKFTVKKTRAIFEATPRGREWLKASRIELVPIVEATRSSDDWFMQWRLWFSRENWHAKDPTDIRDIRHAVPIVAWTAARALKRNTVSPSADEALRQALDDPEDDVRWRAAYVLGSFPSASSCDRLQQIAETGTFKWLSRAAVRSLLEMHLRCPEHALRRKIVDAIKHLLDATLDPEIKRAIEREFEHSYRIEQSQVQGDANVDYDGYKQEFASLSFERDPPLGIAA